jgi:hypothetical protein
MTHIPTTGNFGRHTWYVTKAQEQRAEGHLEMVTRATRGSNVRSVNKPQLTGRILYPVKASTT